MKYFIKVYISHEFKGLNENRDKTSKLIKDLVDRYPNILPISPIHSIGFLYDDVSYDKGIELCLALLDTCDCMVVFGGESCSRGCQLEKKYCIEKSIPIVDINNFDNYYKNIIMR